MTLLFLTSTVSREDILRILEGAGEGDHGPAEECARKAEAELEGELDDVFDEMMPGDLPSEVDFVVGPETKMRVSPKGRELALVAAAVERWLARCPQGPVQLGDPRSGMALQALAYGWSTTVVHALAGEPRSLAELNQVVGLPSYEILAGHVALLEQVGLVEREDHAVAGEIFTATRWLRQGIAPLAAAARLERRDQMEDTAPIDALDVSAGLMLALPLIELPSDLGGACRLEVQLDDGAVAGAVVDARPGEQAWADFDLTLEEVETRASGSIEDWLDTVIEPDAKRVRTRGDRRLAAILVNGLHEALFGAD